MLTTVLFIGTKRWEWPQCSLTDDGWRNEVWCVYTMEYYSAKDNVQSISSKYFECFYHKGMFEENNALKRHNTCIKVLYDAS